MYDVGDEEFLNLKKEQWELIENVSPMPNCVYISFPIYTLDLLLLYSRVDEMCGLDGLGNKLKWFLVEYGYTFCKKFNLF